MKFASRNSVEGHSCEMAVRSVYGDTCLFQSTTNGFVPCLFLPRSCIEENGLQHQAVTPDEIGKVAQFASCNDGFPLHSKLGKSSNLRLGEVSARERNSNC